MENIKITNFRKIKDTWDLDLAPITFFTGKNNSGKSSVLKALMVLSDFGNSKNHFEIHFNGLSKDEHKIIDYSNAINWKNNKKSNLEFSFERNGFVFELIFKPQVNPNNSNLNEDRYVTGELISFRIIRIEDRALIEFVRNGLGYQINIDDTYLDKTYNNWNDFDPEVNQLQEALKHLDVELRQVEEEIKGHLFKNPSLLSMLGISSYAAITTASLSAILAGPLMLAGAGAAAIFSTYKGKELISLKKEAEKLQFNRKQVQRRLTELTAKGFLIKKDKNFLRPQFNLNEISRRELSIENVLRTQVLQYIDSTEKKMGKSDKKQDAEIVYNFAENILKALKFDVYHLSPNRNRQTRLYFNKNQASDINEILENYSQKPLLEGAKEKDFLLEWLNRFEIGTDYKISNISGQANTIEVYDDNRWIDLVDKGFGAGQLFTILLQIAIASAYQKNKENPLLLIEEPESNLHPKLQSELAELFLDAHSKLGVRFIIETHSEYIIRKTQLVGLENKFFLQENKEKNPFKLYYFDSNEPYEMKYKEDSKFERSFGTGFFDVADELAIKTYKLNLKKKK